MTTTILAAAAAFLTAAAALVSGTSIPVAVLLAIASAAAMTDAREHRIPNVLAASAALAATVVWLDQGAPLLALTTAVISATLLVLLWSRGILGGGDAKYLPWLVLTVAALGDPFLALLRVLLFGVLTVGIASLPSSASQGEEGPLVIGTPLALVVSVGL